MNSTTTTAPEHTLGLRHIVLALAALSCTLPALQVQASPLSWLGGERVQGNGSIKKQNRDLAHFTGVSMSLSGNVEVRTGNSESITIETDDNLLPLIETVIEGGTLKIRPIKRNMNIETRNMKVVIQCKEVDRLALGGSGTIDVDTMRAPKLQFDLGGSGTITVKNAESDSVSVALGGSGGFRAGGGATHKLSVSIGGSGDVQAGALKSDDVSVNIGGSGQATVWAKDALSVSIAGSGDVNYYGDPKLSKTVVGSGSARRLGGAPR